MSKEWEELPEGWEWATIGEVCRVNERDLELRKLPDDLPVSFVPMAAVDAGLGAIATPEVRPLKEVRKGFTPFADGDVIFAKITPSMENGKAAIARNLKNGLGFGSTEFHVMRSNGRVLPAWVFHFIRRQEFRNEAKANFAGTAGQLRVPDGFIRKAPIPVAPLPEQRRIVEKLERLLAESRTARKALDKVPALLKRFRQSVLAKAFRGELIERDPNDEPATVLLERIREERRRKWEVDLRAKGKDPKKAKYVEPEPSDKSDLSELPEGWCWANLAQLAWTANYGTSQKCSYAKTAFPVLRIPNVANGDFDLSDIKYSTATLNDADALEQGDLLIIRTNGSKNLIGRTALVQRQFERRYYFASYLIRFRLLGLTDLQRWIAWIWDAPLIRDWIENTVSTSAGQYNISIGDLNKLPIPLPPLAQQRRIVATIESLFAQAEAIERAVEMARRRAEKVDQAVLARAFRGEL